MYNMLNNIYECIFIRINSAHDWTLTISKICSWQAKDPGESLWFSSSLKTSSLETRKSGYFRLSLKAR